MNIIEQARQKITDLQSKYNEDQMQYAVAEQIKMIASENDTNAQHIFNDIDDDKMSIAEVEKLIAAYAKKHKGNCPPFPVADRIIRDFFGLGTASAAPKSASSADDNMINLEDFM